MTATPETDFQVVHFAGAEEYRLFLRRGER